MQDAAGPREQDLPRCSQEKMPRDKAVEVKPKTVTNYLFF